MGKLNKKVKHKIKMDFKIGMLAMVVGIAIVGFVISDTVAYKFTAKCTHPEAGTAGYICWNGNSDSYFYCSIDDYYDGDGIWSWKLDSNTAPSDSGTFYGSSPASISAYAYNSGAIDTPKTAGCTKNSQYAEALSGKSWNGEFGAWAMCADL